MHTAQTIEHLAIKTSSKLARSPKILELEFYSTDAAPKGDINLSGTPQNQHGDTHPIKSQVKTKNREANLKLL